MKQLKIETLISIFVLCAAILIVAIATSSGYLVSHAQFNADALQIPAIAQDILTEKGRLSDWYLSTAPYYFPDIPISIFAYLLTLDSFYQVIWTGIFQTLITFAAIWYFARKITPEKAFSQAVIAIAVIIWVALIPAENFFHKVFSSVFSYLFVTAFHYGSFISLLLVGVLWTACREAVIKEKKILLFVLLCLIAVFGGASDALFIPQAGAALVASVLLANIIHRDFSWKRLAASLIVFISSFLGKYLHHYLNPQPVPVSLDENPLHYLETYFWKNLTAFSEMMLDIIEPAPIYGVFLFCYTIIIIHIIYTQYRKTDICSSEKILLFISLFSFLSIIITAITLTVSWLPLSTDRFLIPLFFFPFIVTILYIGYYFKNGSVILGLFFSSGLLITLGISVFLYVEVHGIKFKIYSDLNHCVDQTLKETGGRNGVTDYWTARPLQLFSKLDLEIAPYRNLHNTFASIEPYHWVTSKRFFKDSYDFALVGNSSRENDKGARKRIIDYNGEPLREVSCEGALLMVYENGKLHLNTRPAILRQQKPVTWRACESSIIYNGTAQEDCSVEVKDNGGTKHMLTLYLQLQPAGRYAIKLAYSSPFAPDKKAADWKVEIRAKIDDLLTSGTFFGTNGKTRTVTKEFKILPEHFGKTKHPNHINKEVEFAVFVPPETDFKLENIEITRLE